MVLHMNGGNGELQAGDIIRIANAFKSTDTCNGTADNTVQEHYNGSAGVQIELGTSSASFTTSTYGA